MQNAPLTTTSVTLQLYPMPAAIYTPEGRHFERSRQRPNGARVASRRARRFANLSFRRRRSGRDSKRERCRANRSVPSPVSFLVSIRSAPSRFPFRTVTTVMCTFRELVGGADQYHSPPLPIPLHLRREDLRTCVTHAPAGMSAGGRGYEPRPTSPARPARAAADVPSRTSDTLCWSHGHGTALRAILGLLAVLAGRTGLTRDRTGRNGLWCDGGVSHTLCLTTTLSWPSA